MTRRPAPACHRRREYIDAHLSIALAGLPVTSLIEDRAVKSIKRFVRTARHYRTTRSVTVKILTATDPLPPDLCDALALIK
jgi:hypothetical protein